MTFDDITGDRKLWAVHFEGEDDNEFYKVFNNWADVVWLRTFFKENIDDLNAYFKITDIKEAISDTIEDSERLRYIIMDISPETDLSKIFRPLDNNQASDVMLQKEKGYVRSIDVAQHLGYSKPSVSRAMSILKASGHIIMERDGRLELTPSGEQVAQEIYERHRWLTDWLIHMGVTPEVAAEDACKIEHDISPETFRCMKEHLDK